MSDSTARPRPAVHVHLNHGQFPGADTRPLSTERPGPYGYGHAAPWCELSYSPDLPESRPVAMLRRALKVTLGFDVVHTYRHRRAINAADIVWTHTEKEHLAIALLKRVGVVRRDLPVIAQTIWLWRHYATWGRLKRSWIRGLLATHAAHTTHSPDNLATARAAFGHSAVLVPYGLTNGSSAVATLPPRQRSGRPTVVAPGNDTDRDWSTLGAAARLLPDVTFVVLSRRKAALRLDSLPNVQVRQAAGLPGMAREYAGADAVVVPLRANDHASGATTVLQAHEYGLPVVVTNTGGIALYAGSSAELCEEGDPTSLAHAITSVLARTSDHESAGMEHMLRTGLTERDYAARHLLLTRSILGGHDLDPRASELSPVWEGLRGQPSESPS